MIPIASQAETYNFKYKYDGVSLEHKTEAKTWEEAFKRSAQSCFTFYKSKIKNRLSEDQGLDIIDVCANPRSLK